MIELFVFKSKMSLLSSHYCGKQGPLILGHFIYKLHLINELHLYIK